MDTAQITSLAYDLGLKPEKESVLKELLDSLNNDPEKMDLVHSILKAEKSQSFFDENHFKSTLYQKKYLDTEFINVCSRILGCIYEPTEFKNTASIYFNELNNQGSIETALNSLKEKGYYVLPTKLSDSIIDSIKGKLKQTPLYMRNRLNNIAGFDEEKLQNIKSNVAWIDDQQDLVKIQEIQDVIFDPFILNVTGKYLESTPIHVQTNFWVSKKYDTSRKALSENAQLFHQDKEFIKFLKVFIYLNDVDTSNGAHVYVEGSHRENKFVSKQGYKFSDRIDDNDIETVYGKEKVIAMEGKKGTIILEDTNGFHKGTPIHEGHRVLLQIEYANSLYFNPVGSFSFDGLQDKHKNFLDQAPRVGLNYNDSRYKSFRSIQKKQRKIKNLKGYIKDKIRRFLNI